MDYTAIYDVNGVVDNPGDYHLQTYINDLNRGGYGDGKEYMQCWHKHEFMFYINNDHTDINYFIVYDDKYNNGCSIKTHYPRTEFTIGIYKKRKILEIKDPKIINLMMIRGLSIEEITFNMKKLSKYLRDFITLIEKFSTNYEFTNEPKPVNALQI